MITAIDHIVQRRKTSVNISRSDLLQHLIENGANASNNTRMSTRQIVDQMSEILLAGSETTSGTTACLFLELARNPEVKAKLLASLTPLGFNDPIIGNRKIRTGDQYRYLNACIKENLRLHPIASEMGRRTGSQSVNLMGYNLPPHTVISASYRNLQRNGEYWPQPLRFWPERWLDGDERGDAQRQSRSLHLHGFSHEALLTCTSLDAYYPFSAGKHSCIGIK